MARMKTFFIYALIIILFFLYSNLLIKVGMRSVYKQIEEGKIIVGKPKIEVTDARATYVNGYVEGNVINNTENKINKKYIKLDFYSKRDILLATKYVEIENLEVNQKQDFKMAFKATDVYRFEASIVDNAEGAKDIEFFSEELSKLKILKMLLILCII